MPLTDLGILYEYGVGVKRDYERAVKLYQRAAEQQYPPAILSLGICYRDGRGVQQDFKQAFNYFLKAARLGDANAMFNLACYYRDEKKGKTNYVKALKWFIKSFEKNGDLCAALQIGKLYEEGSPRLKPDLKEAEKWYEIAQDEKLLERVRAKMNTADNPSAGNCDAEYYEP